VKSELKIPTEQEPRYSEASGLARTFRKPVLLFLSRLSDFSTIPIAATLAWLCRSKGRVFDNYYDSHHEGVHFPGGDWRTLDLGKLTGGTVCADRHFEEFYHLLLHFDVAVVTTGECVLGPSLKRLDVPVIVDSSSTSQIYRKTFTHFGVPLPRTTVMIGSNRDPALKGLEAFLATEVWLREGLGIHETISAEELEAICEPGSAILCVCVHKTTIERLEQAGFSVDIVDHIDRDDNYSTVTKRLVKRWSETAKGWLLGDPVVACHWLPKSCEDRLIPIYGIPQHQIIRELGDTIQSKGSVVYGRQSSDHDFFALSKLNQSFQVIDPCRPPFQSIRHLDATWEKGDGSRDFFAPEYSDEQLERFCSEGRVLISLLFWNGMIRELVNLYPLFDLLATTHLRCGLVFTSEIFDYMVHPPMELLTIPVEDGGVYPLAEVLLGSCGVGVAVESAMDPKRLSEQLVEGLQSIRRRVNHEGFVPRGWWGTMDTDLKPLSWGEKPTPVQFFHDWPWLRLRIPPEEPANAIQNRTGRNLLAYLRSTGRSLGMSKFAEPLRPFESYGPGKLKQEIVDAVKSSGLSYMFTKADFRSVPKVQYIDDELVALNYTAGQWDGWTPFETVNSVRDLRKAEKRIAGSRKPGWIVSTIDTCQWTFGWEFWNKAPELLKICRFCSAGGDSGTLLNVKPFTLARYARIISGKNPTPNK
jgi:hypothetical protein